MSVSLIKDPKMVRASLTIKRLYDIHRGVDNFRNRHIELRPGNCLNRDGMCDCLSGTRRPLVNLSSNCSRWH